MSDPLQFTRAQAAHHPCPKCGGEGQLTKACPVGNLNERHYQCINGKCRVYYPEGYRYHIIRANEHAEKVPD